MECLVTKLRGAVNDNSLLRMGEMRIGVKRVSSPSSKTQGFTFGFNKDVRLEIVGDGYFTDKALTANTGKSMTVTKDQVTDVYVSNGDFELAVTDKYALTNLSFYSRADGSATQAQMSNRTINLTDLSYSTAMKELLLSNTQLTGTLSDLRNLTALTTLTIGSTQISGDISALSGMKELTTLYANNCQISGDISALSGLSKLAAISLGETEVSGDISALGSLTSIFSMSISNLAVRGNLSSLAGLTKLQILNLNNTAVTGDISALATLKSLVQANLSNIAVSGNISALSGLKSLSEFSTTSNEVTGDVSALSGLTSLQSITLADSQVTGDLALIAPNCVYIGFGTNYSGSGLTWSTRPSSAKILAINGFGKLDNVDKMLQDQAECVKGFTESSPSWYKVISVVGTRTSSSDTAMAQLQEMGYTITIRNEE